jgi:hypothetical protein
VWDEPPNALWSADAAKIAARIWDRYEGFYSRLPAGESIHAKIDSAPSSASNLPPVGLATDTNHISGGKGTSPPPKLTFKPKFKAIRRPTLKIESAQPQGSSDFVSQPSALVTVFAHMSTLHSSNSTKPEKTPRSAADVEGKAASLQASGDADVEVGVPAAVPSSALKQEPRDSAHLGRNQSPGLSLPAERNLDVNTTILDEGAPGPAGPAVGALRAGAASTISNRWPDLKQVSNPDPAPPQGPVSCLPFTPALCI